MMIKLVKNAVDDVQNQSEIFEFKDAVRQGLPIRVEVVRDHLDLTTNFSIYKFITIYAVNNEWLKYFALLPDDVLDLSVFVKDFMPLILDEKQKVCISPSTLISKLLSSSKSPDLLEQNPLLSKIVSSIKTD